MPDTPSRSAPSWAPRRVLDVNAQQANLKLLEVLHDATAAAARPLFMARLAPLGRTGVAQKLLDQAQELSAFLLKDPLHKPLAEALAPYLCERLSHAEAADVDRKLAAQLAREFAVSVWTTLTSVLRREHATGGLVEPSDMLPGDRQAGSSRLLNEVLDDTRHFRVTLPQLNEVLAQAMANVARFRLLSGEAFVNLPHGMQIDAGRLLDAADRALKPEWLADAEGQTLASAAGAEIDFHFDHELRM